MGGIFDEAAAPTAALTTTPFTTPTATSIAALAESDFLPAAIPAAAITAAPDAGPSAVLALPAAQVLPGIAETEVQGTARYLAPTQNALLRGQGKPAVLRPKPSGPHLGKGPRELGALASSRRPIVTPDRRSVARLSVLRQPEQKRREPEVKKPGEGARVEYLELQKQRQQRDAKQAQLELALAKVKADNLAFERAKSDAERAAAAAATARREELEREIAELDATFEKERARVMAERARDKEIYEQQQAHITMLEKDKVALEEQKKKIQQSRRKIEDSRVG